MALQAGLGAAWVLSRAWARPLSATTNALLLRKHVCSRGPLFDSKTGRMLTKQLRYTIPAMDDNDAKNTGGKYRMIPIFEKAVSMAAATKGLKILVGSGVGRDAFPHGIRDLREGEGGKTASQLGSYVELPKAERRKQD